MAIALEEYQRPVAGGEIDTIRALLHDLRQPLAAILLLSGTDAGDVARKMEGISGQARWLADLVEVVLSGAADDEVRCTDLDGLLADVVRRARATAQCSIELDTCGASGALARPVALSRAVACVLDNAVRAAGPDGRVTVAVMADPAEPEIVRITVSDNGPGLGKVAGRTSLGLTTTRAMVAACHGAFHLRAGADGGAVAEIALPASGRESAATMRLAS